MIYANFFTKEYKDIIIKTFEEFGVTPEGFIKFWNWTEVTLDGDFKLSELDVLVTAMKRVSEKHI